VRHLASALDISKKPIRLAAREQTLASTAFPAGDLPPFDNPTPLRTFTDPTALARDWVHSGAGHARQVKGSLTAEMVRTTSGMVTCVRIL